MAPMMGFASLLQQIACGAIAAAGFGVLFNVGSRTLSLCAASGATALGLRTCCLGMGMSLEGASFVAALSVGAVLHFLHPLMDVSHNVPGVAGCIAMVPGSFAAKAIIGLFALTTGSVGDELDMLVTATKYALRVFFITGAIGTGLAVPSLLFRRRVPQ